MHLQKHLEILVIYFTNPDQKKKKGGGGEFWCRFIIITIICFCF